MITTKLTPAQFKLPLEFNRDAVIDGQLGDDGFAYFTRATLERFLLTPDAIWRYTQGNDNYEIKFSDQTVIFVGDVMGLIDQLLYTAGPMLNFECVNGASAAWQKAIRDAQAVKRRIEADENAAEERAAAEKNADEGAILGRVLSRVLGFGIDPLSENEWVSPSGIYLAIARKTSSSTDLDFTEGKPLNFDRNCWWFRLLVWKPAPKRLASAFWRSGSMPVCIVAQSHEIDGDWIEIRAKIADAIDQVENAWATENARCETEVARNSGAILGLPSETPADRLAAAIVDMITEVVRGETLY